MEYKNETMNFKIGLYIQINWFNENDYSEKKIFFYYPALTDRLYISITIDLFYLM